MKSTASTGFARRLLVTVVVMAFAPVVFVQSSGAQVTANQTFFVLNNPNDRCSISCLVSTTEMSSSAKAYAFASGEINIL
jgi:hypothetical protein